MKYIINDNTMYIIFNGVATTINENGLEMEYQGNYVKKILDDSCIYYGSSLKGRIKGAKSILNNSYKLPILISEKRKIVLFPLSSLKNNEIILINFSFIKEYNYVDNFINVIFKNNIEKKFLCSNTIFNNQINKCSRLLWIYENNR